MVGSPPATISAGPALATLAFDLRPFDSFAAATGAATLHPLRSWSHLTHRFWLPDFRK